MNRFTVEAESQLLPWLTARLGNRTQAKQHLKFRRVAVNGETASRHDLPLRAGDVVGIGQSAGQPAGPVNSSVGLKILFEDDDLLVIDKPAGLLTISTDSEKSNTAYYRATEHRRRASRSGEKPIFVVHRLDRETSGVLLFACNPDAKQALQDTWDSVEKTYLAVVERIPDPPSGTVESYLTESRTFQVFSGPKSKHGKHALTEYRTLAVKKSITGESRALLEVRTLTGRKHQIRVHMADLGHPIVGDDRYGDKKTFRRLGLHASALRIRHPADGRPLELRSPFPAELARLVPPRGRGTA